jgi:nucleoside phosphorylase
MSKEHVDIGFIIPLREEFERLIATFPRISDGTHGTQYHAILDMGDGKLTGVAFIQNEMGKDAAARATTTLLDLYDVGLIMVLGIAGGLSGDAAIGDVCITGTVFDVLENAKFSDNNGRLLPEFAPIIHHTDELLSFCVKYISLGKDTAGIFDDWRLSQYYAALARIPGEFIGRNNTNEAIAIPDIHVGSIACGAVSKSEDYVSALKKLDRKILAIETESGGVFKVAYTANVPAVTIRGICDYADKNKTRLEQQTNNQARFVAADNVITFVKAQLENQQFIRFVENRRQSTLDGVLFPQGDANSQGLPKILKKIDETIHYHLTQLSPHYQNKPQGYRLPLPRIKRPEERISATPMSRS